MQAIVRAYREARRRKVFRTAALYVVGAWLALQVADTLFPGFGIPDAAIRALFWTAVLGFPLAVVFGWLYEVGPGGIRRTSPADAAALDQPQPLARRDYLILAAFAAIALVLGYRAVQDVREMPLDDDSPAAAAGPSRTTSERLASSIAVLPFANISDDTANEYFCDGISEEILNRLGGISGLNVIGRTSSFAFKGSDYGIDRISALLGVRYVLQGSVRKAADQLRVSAQLLDESGVQVWSQSFDRRLENVFEIQSEIAAAVASVVAAHVLPMPETSHQPQLEAYDHYLAGRALLHQRDGARAREELEKAVGIDPLFAEAYAELALAKVFDGTDLGQVRQSLDRALQLSPRSLRGRAIDGLWLTLQTPPDLPGAERVLREVLAQDPNMSDALNWLQGVLREQGRDAEARAILERAATIDPLHAAIAANYSDRLFKEGRIDEAIAIVRRQLAQPAPGPLAYAAGLDLLENGGHLVEVHELARELAMRPTPPLGYFPLAESYARFGDWAAVDAWMNRQQRMWPDSPYTTGQRVLQRAWQGKFDEAVRYGRESFARRDMRLTDVPEPMRHGMGFHLARAGEYAAAIEILEPLYDLERPETMEVFTPEPSYGPHGLAWAYQKTGATDQAERLLEVLARRCAEGAAPGRKRDSQTLFRCAQTELLRGHREQALDLLGQAVDAGWRGYYVRQKDPFWAVLADDPRYQALIARVKADLARQGAEIRRVDAAEDLGAKADAAYAASGAVRP